MNKRMTSVATGLGLVLAVALTVAGCSSSGATTAPTNAPAATTSAAAASAALPSAAAASGGAAGSAVSVKDFAFDPTTITVKTGQAITWTNGGSASHTVTFDTGGVDSGTLKAGATFSHTFDAAGAFTYHCNFHASMKGTVTVTQ